MGQRRLLGWDALAVQNPRYPGKEIRFRGVAELMQHGWLQDQLQQSERFDMVLIALNTSLLEYAFLQFMTDDGKT